MADTNTATASNDSDQDWTRYDGARGGKGWKSSSGEIRYQEEKPSGSGGGSDETGSGSSKDDAGGFNDDGAAASEDAKASYEEAKAESLNTMSFLRDQSITSVPDGAETIPSDVFVDADGDGVTDYCRVGVPAFSSPPPPKIPRLPNLTKWERLAESEFADAFEKDPEKMVDAYEALMETKGKSGTYETDAAKAISRFWNDDDQEIQASKRGVFNTALHQTANAIVKKAFLRRLDSMKPGDQIMVTNGGVGCHAAGSGIMMYDCSVKMVEDVLAGDQLMGPDSSPRNVLRLIRGVGKMFWVHPTKGKPFIVNEDHILSLKTTRMLGSKKRTISVLNISVKDALKRGKAFIRGSWLYRSSVEFEYTDVPIDPYFLGIWLGDGSKHNASVTSADEEVVDFAGGMPNTKVSVYDKKDNQSSLYTLSSVKLGRLPGGSYQYNHTTKLLSDLGVLNNKHIPDLYKRNSRQVRLEILAGLLDTGGSLSKKGFDFISKLRVISDGVAFIARSLGLSAYVTTCRKKSQTGFEGLYHRVSISGNTDEIPTKILRKKAGPRLINKNPLHVHVGYSIEEIGEGEYFGFQLDGDSLYLLDDFTVTHNSGKGHSLGSVDEAIAMKGASGAVWDSAGDQNATENPWILAEAKKRGLKVNFMFVHANPNDVWSNPDFGVIKRAKDPKDGRMVDAAVFVDSYAIGARNHFAFMQRNSNDPDVNFITLDNYARPKMGDDGQPVMENGKPKMASTPKMVKGFPQDAMAVNRDELYQFAVASIHQMDDVPERIKYGALMGSRVWPGEFVKEKTEKKMSTLGLVRYTKRLEWNRRGSGSGWSRYF